MALDFSVNKMNIKAITTTLVIAALTGSVIELATCESASAQDRGARFTFAPQTFAPGLNQRHRHYQSSWVPAPQMHQVSHGTVSKKLFDLSGIPKQVQRPVIAQTAVTPQMSFNNAWGNPVAPATVAPQGLSATPKQLPAFRPAAKNVSGQRVANRPTKRVNHSAPRTRNVRPAVAAAPAGYGNKYFKPGSFVQHYTPMQTDTSLKGVILNNKKH